MKAALRVRILTEADYPAWNRLVQSSPQGSPYSSPEYLSALCEATGAAFHLLAVERGDELVGGVPLYEVKSGLGLQVSPRLLLYYNGVVLRAYDTRYPSQRTARHLEVLTALEQAVASRGYASVVFKNRSTFTDARPFLSAGWTARPSYTYVVPLNDLGKLRGRVEQNLRRLIERCSRQGLRMTEDDDFESYFRMHHETHERKGMSLYLPRAAFERFFARLRSQRLVRLYHARLPDGRSITAQLVLAGNHPVTHNISAAACAEHQSLGATPFLRFKVFEELASQGFAANDLTDAALNPVTHFKGQLGGDLELCLVLEAPPRAGTRLARWLRAANEGARRVLKPADRGRGGH